jgi:hypothetical protein
MVLPGSPDFQWNFKEKLFGKKYNLWIFGDNML